MNKKPIVIAYNAVNAKIFTDDQAVKNRVNQALSYIVEGAEHMAAAQSGHWSGRSSFFKFKTCTFPAGFFHLVQQDLERAGYTVRMVRTPLPEPLGPPSPVVDRFGNGDARYDFQLKSLRQVERHGRGIIRVATGGGKSKIAKLITARYRRMTLFLTTRSVLMYQMEKQLREDCGFNVGVIGDGEWRPVRGVNVGMVQTLVEQLKETSADAERRELIGQLERKNIATDTPAVKKAIAAAAEKRFKRKTLIRERAIKLLAAFEVVIGEEAHEAGGNSYYEILRHCKNANIRVALTATPFMREAQEDNMRLMAAFGPILIQVPEKLLIDRAILATPYFRFVDSKPHPKLRKTSPWQRAVQLGYTENPYLLEDLVAEAKTAAGLGLSTLTLIQRKQHGANVEAAMRAAGLQVSFIQGENDNDERRRELDRLARGDIDVLIGTTILDVGVDVPAIGLVQLAGGGKAEVALRQRIGRGLRAKKSGPNVCFVSDYSVAINKYLSEHAKQRRALIQTTPGFAEGVLKPGEDFPWSLFSAAPSRAA